MVCIGPCEKCVSGFHISASEHLVRLSSRLEVDGRVVPVEEILQSESHLAMLWAKLCRDGFPYRTPLQISVEMLRLQDKYDRNVTNSRLHQTDVDRYSYGRSCLWIISSDDDDDFMPSSKERRVEAVRKGKEKKAEASSKGKGKEKKVEASSKGKGKKAESSSKCKGGNTADGAGCIDGR